MLGVLDAGDLALGAGAGAGACAPAPAGAFIACEEPKTESWERGNSVGAAGRLLGRLWGCVHGKSLGGRLEEAWVVLLCESVRCRLLLGGCEPWKDSLRVR